MTYLSTIWPCDLRPRVIGEAIVIGRDTVLARRVDSQGLWTLDRPRPAVTARLLSVAYGKPIAEDDWCMQLFDRACLALRGNPTEADRLLRDMPHPEVAAMLELAKAARLLKDGVAPDRLDRALRNPDLRLPRTPAWAPELALSEDGVVLGDGTVIAPLINLPGGGCGLGIEGREAEILALLSIARREPAPPAMLTKLAVASQALAAGDPARAAMVLCQSGQPRIDDRELAKGLAGAAELMADGMSPASLIKAIGMKPAEAVDRLGKSNPNHLGCGPGGGQFCSAAQAGQDGAQVAENSKPTTPKKEMSADEKKRGFVERHYEDAKDVADALGVPVENILGISAVESGWGGIDPKARFARDGNNYFGQHAPATYQIGTMPIERGRGQMAVFATPSDSFQAFGYHYGSRVQGTSDPAEFARILQNTGGFGIDRDTGAPVKAYVPNVSSTIVGLRPYVWSYESKH